MVDNDTESTRARVVRLAFGGNEGRYHEFLQVLEDVMPKGGHVILRGSAVTGTRWSDGLPFDADGPGTSDLDVTFLCGDILDLWTSFYIPRLHTVPLSEEHPDACPPLNDVRGSLCQLAGRPVNLQASTSLVQFVPDVLFDQPYFTLIGKPDEPGETEAA